MIDLRYQVLMALLLPLCLLLLVAVQPKFIKLFTRFHQRYSQAAQARVSPFLLQTRKWVPALVVFFLLFQFLLFRTNFLQNLLPYYPAYHDQLATYKAVYQAAFTIRENGILEAARAPLEIKTGVFKGWLLQGLGLLSVMTFGPHRLAIAYANFFFFLCGQLGLAVLLYKWKGWPAALMGVGLFLLSNAYTPYPAGGLLDLRLDYAGMVTFGMSFLALVHFIEQPNNNKLWLCLLVFQITLWTRSITLVYILGIQLLVLSYQFYGHLRNRDFASAGRLPLFLLGGTLAEAVVFAILQGSKFYGYYVAAGEGIIRNGQVGLASYWERPAYYIQSFQDTFIRYLPFLILAVAGLAAKYLLYKYRQSGAEFVIFPNRRARVAPWLFLAAVLCVYVPVNLYAPTPVVMSILAIPLVYTLVVHLTDWFDWLPRAMLGGLAVLILAIGFGNYASAMVAPGHFPWGNRKNAQMVNDLHREIELVVRNNQTIYWMLIDQGTNHGTFYVHWAERYSEVPPLTLVPPIISSISEAELFKNLEQAHIVVAPLEPFPIYGYRFPYSTSLEEIRGDWESYLESEFTLRQTYEFPQGKIGLFVRNVLVSRLENENGLERLGNLPFFWLGEESTSVYVQSSRSGEVTFTAVVNPGPSLPETNVRHLRISTVNESYDLVILDGQNTLTFTVPVRPGENKIELLSLDSPSLSELSNGDPRTLMLGFLDLHITGFQGH